MEEVKTSLPIQDFPGLVTNVSPHDVPPGGTVVQINAACIKPGELTVRGGYREVVFDA